MNEGRLHLVGRQVARKRKLTAISNDHVKSRLNRQQDSLLRESTIVSYKREKETKPYLNKLVDLRGYKKSLTKFGNSKGAHLPSEQRVFGKYAGATYKDLKPTIKQMVSWNHPRQRRLREVNRLLETGFNDGHLLEEDKAKSRLNKLVHKPFPKFEWRDPNAIVPEAAELKLPPLKAERKHFFTQQQPKEYKALINLLYINRSHTIL